MAAVAASARDTLLVACRPCCGVAPSRPRIPRGRTRAWQAADRLLGLNSKDKGGSAYLCAKVTNARNTLLGEPVPHHVETKACMAGQGSPEPPKRLIGRGWPKLGAACTGMIGRSKKPPERQLA